MVDTALDVARGLAFLHGPAHRLVHRDLSPANVLLTSAPTPRGFRALLSDFGLSTVLALDATHRTSEMKGTIAYMPPEVFESDAVSIQLDVYSLGVLRECPPAAADSEGQGQGARCLASG
jgi:interleukin-1 receptor-associated kinase 1